MSESTKEVLENINKPFRDNFIKILELFLNSENNHEFYRRVISYQDMPSFVESNKNMIIAKNDYLIQEQLENDYYTSVNYFGALYPIEHRLTLNVPEGEVINLLEYFIYKATEEKVPFAINYILKNEIETNESVIIGSNTNSFTKHLNILRSYKEEYPQNVEKFGKPSILCGVIDGWIGFSDAELFDKNKNYTESRLDILNFVINKYLYENMDVAVSISANEFMDLFNYVKENNKSYEERSFLSNIQLSKLSRTKLVRIINTNSNIITYLYKDYINECKKQSIDSLNPIFYMGSKNDIISHEDYDFEDFDIDVNDILSNENPEVLVNYYIKHNIYNRFSPKDNIMFLENIIEKEIEDHYEDYRSYRDLCLLYKNGIIAKNLYALIEKNIYPENKIQLLKEFFENVEEINESSINKKIFVKKDTYKTLENNLCQKNMSEDEILKYSLEAIKNILVYFERSIVRRSEKERKIQLLEKFRNEISTKAIKSNNIDKLIDIEISNLKIDERLFSRFKKADTINKVQKRLLSKNINNALIYELKKEKGNKKTICFD